MKKQNVKPTLPGTKPFPVVAIGASEGGSEAARELFGSLPESTGMCYVYLQHRNKYTADMLLDLIAGASRMPVQELKENTRLEPDTIYLIFSDQRFVLEKGTMKLQAEEEEKVLFPIDHFFASVADDQKQAAIGILLSGSATDGTIGLKTIKAAGGITMVQNESALFRSMAQSAITEDVADLVLSPQEMASELERISHKHALFFSEALADDTLNAVDEEGIANIMKLLKKSVGVDFSHYKRSTIRRRIIRRMLLYRLDKVSDYYQYLKLHVNEAPTLYKDLLINVTCFFRDTDCMEFLKKTILPKIIKSKNNEPLRIWVPACSTGQEAYSLAMIAFEVLGTRATTTPIQIFATDLSEQAIGKARLGFYSKNDLAEVSPKRLQRFFTKVDGGYRIIKAIRDLCIFAPHNVFKDPPFSRMDLISCCNLFIYLEAPLQKKIIATFHYALNPLGHLVLGKSEALGGSTQLFNQLEKKYKVFARKEASSKAILDMSYRLPDAGIKGPIAQKPSAAEMSDKRLDFEKSVDEIMLSRFVPPSIIVNHELEILQFRGSTGMYLEPSSGKASFNVLKMARQGLAFELRNIIHKANKTQQPSQKTGLKLKHAQSFHTVSIEAIPLKGNNEERLFLVVFKETAETDPEQKVSPTKDKLVKKLQDELETLREDMRAIVEDQEVSNEELQSANEEIISANEELQSINEELETSKEEVESSNEELMTINQELHVRNEQLAESYDYAEAVFTTIRESVLLLDKTLRIKNANLAFYNTFHLKESDTEDFLLYEVANGQWKIPALEKAISQILSGEVSLIQGLEITHRFSQAGEKVMLVNIRRIIQKSHGKELLLLAIEDISDHRKGMQIIEQREAWFRAMADSAPVIIWVTDTDRNITFFNKTWFDFTGTSNNSAERDEWLNMLHADDREKFIKIFGDSFATRREFNMEYRLRDNKGNYRWVLCDAKPTYNYAGEFTGFTGTVTDIHGHKKMSEELERRVKRRTNDLLEANKSLERSNSELEQFAYVASHDLQEPLRKILTFSDRLQTRHKAEVSAEAAEYLSKISESSFRMTELIDDLLDFSRVANGENLFEQVDLNEVLSGVLKNVEITIQERQVKIDVQNTLPVINAVRVQMIQLFQNLIGNAIKFSKKKKDPQITLKAELLSPELIRKHQLQKNRTYWCLSFRDNGIGFEQEYADQIFVIFKRLNDKRFFPGTGIGLALCKKIVQHHEGIIFAEAKKDLGATFYVVLPV